MNLRAIALALATAGLVAAPAAAQQLADAGAATAATPGSGAAIEWPGLPLTAEDGSVIGTVSAVTTDETGAVTGVRIKIGGGPLGLFTREMTIPMARILLEQDGRLVSEVTTDEIEKALAVRG
jgi:PRC-barrel domain